nr:sugar transferase [uncultured Devosia sp.]
MPRDLTFVTSLGGHTRQHRYLPHLTAFFWLAVISVIVQVLSYSAFVFPFKGVNPDSILLSFFALGTPVAAASMVLAAFRRHDSPIISALAVYGALFLAMVSIISATRAPISYVALSICGTIGLFLICAANYRFHLLGGEKVRIMPFAGANIIQEQVPGSRILTLDEVANFPTKIDFDILLVDDISYENSKYSEFISRMHILGIDIINSSTFLERVTGRVNIDKFEIFHVVYSPSQLLYSQVKRILDLFFIVIFSPVLIFVSALTAIYIFIRDPGPVLFIQIRRGFGNRPFRMYKFRTMFQGTAGGSTDSGDARIIPGCGILRKLRIDEIPQCFNILKGDMSLVGPRPVAEYVAKASIKAEPKYAYRCVVQPGITGWAQVTSGYASTVSEEITKLSYDLYYIKKFSIDMDIVILTKTIKTVLFRKGAK